MRFIGLFLALGIFGITLQGCGGADNCADVECVNGDCVDGQCDCDEGWTGEKCDTEKEPKAILIDKIVILKFPTDDSGKPWDDEDDNSLGDISVRVSSVEHGNYFTPKDIDNDVAEDADGSSSITVDTNFRIRNMDESVNFEVVDYDIVGGFNIEWEFVSSVSTKFSEHYKGFPSKITLQTSSGKTQLEIHIAHEH